MLIKENYSRELKMWEEKWFFKAKKKKALLEWLL